jgi:hypothetical protein
MRYFQLLGSYIENLEKLLRSSRHHQVPLKKFMENSDPIKEGGYALN